jgi:hypothetical protein
VVRSGQAKVALGTSGVFQTGSVRTPTIGRPRPLRAYRLAHPGYTRNCDEGERDLKNHESSKSAQDRRQRHLASLSSVLKGTPNHSAVTQVGVTTATLLSSSLEADETAPHGLASRASPCLEPYDVIELPD